MNGLNFIDYLFHVCGEETAQGSKQSAQMHTQQNLWYKKEAHLH
jgi:hypothetical protein